MTRRSILVASLFAGLATGLTACTVGPDYTRPQDAKINQVSKDFIEARGPAVSGAAMPGQWWHLYESPILDRLITQALASNSDIKIAAANVARADAFRAEVADASAPHTELSGDLAYGAPSAEEHLLFGKALPSDFVYSLGAGLSYPLDLAGQLKRAEEAAAADRETVAAAYDRSRLGIAAEVVRAYLDICAAGRDADLAQSLVSLQEQMKDANDKLIAAGRVPLSSRQGFEAQLWRLKSAMPVLEARRKTAGYRLAALLGDVPEKLPPEAMQCRQVPLSQKPIPTGDGKDFLARRPDVRQAESAAKAASARIGVAMGDLYPHVSLGIAAGSTGLVSHIGQSDTYKYSLGPLISWDFPNRAAVRARISGAQATQAAALANFDAVVVNALRDGETALSVYARDLDQNSALRHASADRARARTDSEALYARGRQSLMEQLEARRAHLLAEQELAASQAKLAGDQVMLFWVFGGGW